MNKLITYSFIFIIVFSIIISLMGASNLDYSNYGINPDDILISSSRLYLAYSK